MTAFQAGSSSVFRGGGGFGRFPMTGDPIQLLVALLLFAVLLWVAYRLITR